MPLDPTAMPTAPVAWAIHRRPHAAMWLWASALGAIALIASWWFVTRLYDHPYSDLIGFGVGLIVGGLIPLHIGRGGRCQIHDDGSLVYGFGTPFSIVVPLRAVTGLRMIRTGMLRGVGIDLPTDQIQFLHRKGLSPARCDAYRDNLGVAVVLEFLTADDLTVIAEWRDRFRAGDGEAAAGSQQSLE